jgi:hypothetical protein
VCVTTGQSPTWQYRTEIHDADDVFTRWGVMVFQDRAVVVGTAGTWHGRQLVYDAAMWTCEVASGLSCGRVADSTGVLGGPQDQFISSAGSPRTVDD